MKAPVCSSAIAWRSCSCVFITIGPYHATGSSIGLPDTSTKRDTLVARLHHDLDATVEEHQRVVTDIVHGRRIGFLDLLRQNRAWIRRVAEGARAHEHVGKSIARGLDFETLPLARGNRDIEVIRIGCRAFPTGPLF